MSRSSGQCAHITFRSGADAELCKLTTSTIALPANNTWSEDNRAADQAGIAELSLPHGLNQISATPAVSISHFVSPHTAQSLHAFEESRVKGFGK